MAQGREFVWTDADFSQVQSLIYQRAGINLHEGKHAMVYSRLSRRLRETGYTSWDYLGWLETHDGAEWQEFINALTTNLTAFFVSSITSRFCFALEVQACGDAVAGLVQCGFHREEPYSIVATALESLGANANFQADASDIDSRVLARPPKVCTGFESLKGLTQSHLQRFFMKGKSGNSGLVR